ncbi:helix-turn-helix domain-containing protein [Paenibacillus sp. BC26]|uniref:helix-turn-helix domain-containing protein n=1 Tax=Paenibacillus sp. BC26 TaxID=1881032 RepID=UPI0008E4BBB3|nr:helix-turn-helix domain-containing protein [Paenibacillus sp. BC26]SFT05049.1 Two-component response regulator, YesN/AraC family, consists of REC and AraC-type DNA-binding domains [Paenibacillus sp. BC26]
MRSFSFLTKLTFFCFLLSTLPVLFIGIFSYVTSSNEIQKDVNKGKIQLLEQINANVEQILTTVNHTLNQVINSAVLKNAMNSSLTVSDFNLYGNLRDELLHMQSFDTKLEDVVLINKRHNWMIKNSGLYRFDQYAFHAQLDGLIEAKSDTAWVMNPSHLFYSEESAGSAMCTYSVSLIKKLPVTEPNPYGLIMANIPTCSLQSLLQHAPDQSDMTLIIDDQYRIIVHPDRDFIGKPLSAIGFDQENKLNEQIGQFSSDIDHQSFSVTYYKSPTNGWIYMSITSIASLTKESKKIGLYTVAVCAFMLLITMLLAWLGSRRMYSPIERLLKQIDVRKLDIRQNRTNEFQAIGEQIRQLAQSKTRLESELHQHLKQVRTFFLAKAFQGNVKRGDLTEQLERFGFSAQLEEWHSMAVVTLQIDSLDETRYGKQDIELLLFAVQNMIEELIPPENRLVSLTIDHTVVTLFGSAAAEIVDFKTALFMQTEQLQQQIQSFLHLTVSIGISLPFHDIGLLPAAYQEGLDALKYRLKLGEGIVIQYEHVNAGKHYFIRSYPSQLENDLIDAIKLAEKEKAKEILQAFLSPVFSAKMSPQEYHFPLVRLLNSLLVVKQESGISMNQIGSGRSSLFEELFELNTVPEIEDWFWTRIIFPMVRIFRDRQEAQYSNISEKIIDLIHRHYDTDLSLEECAAKLNYNSNYLSSVFRKETNSSFSEYLATYRFSMAKKWLRESDIPVKDIASRLRYNNPQNFIRSFRKLEGITPGQYRERHTAS